MNLLKLLVLFLVFLADKYWQNQLQAPNFVSSYLDDILLIPLCMGTALYVQQHWINPLFIFSKQQIIFTCLFFCIVFEGIFPFFNSEYTRDFMDIPAYAAGALFFGLFLNRKV